MSPRVTLIDYGIGNLFNLQRAFQHEGATSELVSDVDSIRSADRLVIPGVGAFGEGITNLQKLGLVDAIRDFVSTGKPVIGICLGMQLLLSRSEELGDWKGLEIVPGDVKRFKDGDWKLPQITWNGLEPARSWRGTVLENIADGSLMYFNHSYFVQPQDPACVLATTSYAGISFCSVLHKNNIFACQFHPERSAAGGLRLLANFSKLNF